MALAIWRSKLLTTLRDALPMQPAELIARARALPWPAPVQRVAQRGLRALAKRSKTAAWLLDRAQEALEAATAAPFSSAASSTSARSAKVSFDVGPAFSTPIAVALAAAPVSAAFEVEPEPAAAIASELAIATAPAAEVAIQTEPLPLVVSKDPLPDALDALAYAMRSVSAETCVAAIADLTDRGDAAAGALLLDLLEDSSGFFIDLSRLAAARGLQRVREVDGARVERLLRREQDLGVAHALHKVLAALHRS